jgi:hypothetical protein
MADDIPESAEFPVLPSEPADSAPADSPETAVPPPDLPVLPADPADTALAEPPVLPTEHVDPALAEPPVLHAEPADPAPAVLPVVHAEPAESTASAAKSWWAILGASGIQLVLGAAALAIATLFGFTGHLSATDTFSVYLALAGVTGVAGGLVLGSTTPNINIIPHVVFTLFLLAAATVLVIHNVFSSVQILPLFGLVIGSGATGVGSAGR